MRTMIEALLYIYLFIVGLVFGSFFNVVGIRLAANQSIIYPRSYCPNCKCQLTAMELIPVLSFLMQKGRCKGCQEPISLQYPLVECITALLFVTVPLRVGWSSELVIAFLLISLLITVTVADLENMIIPNKVLLFFGCLMLVLRLFLHTSPWWDSYLGAIVAFFLLFLISLLSKGAMGGGDIKLFTVLGMFVGTAGVIWTLFLASLFGLIYGVIQIARKVRRRKEPLPFAPFISIAAMIFYFFTDELNDFIQLFLIAM